MPKETWFRLCLFFGIFEAFSTISHLTATNIYAIEGWEQSLSFSIVFLLLALLLHRRYQKQMEAYIADKEAERKQAERRIQLEAQRIQLDERRIQQGERRIQLEEQRIQYEEQRKRQEELLQSKHSRLAAEQERLKDAKARFRAGTTTEEYKVAGTSYRKEIFEKIGAENEEYSYGKSRIIREELEGVDIPKYDFLGTYDFALSADPDNPYDHHAVKVLIDGQHVGFIPASSSAHVSELMDTNRIVDMEAKLVGGPYKYYDSEEDRIVCVDLDFGIRLTLFVKPAES